MRSTHTRRPLHQQAVPEQQGPFFSHAGKEARKKDDVFFQTKLAVGGKDDKHEKEADGVANKVQKKEEEKKDPAVQKMAKEEKDKPVQKIGAADKKDEDKKVQKKEEEKKEKPVQKMSDGDKKEEKKVQKKESGSPDKDDKLQKKEAGGGAHAAHKLSVEERIKMSKGKGSALPKEIRQSLEAELGVDLGSVRIHNDNEAAAMNKDLNALAFTNGADVYFNTGQYAPDSAAGKKLLAHELTHVVQQTGPAKKEKKSK